MLYEVITQKNKLQKPRNSKTARAAQKKSPPAPPPQPPLAASLPEPLGAGTAHVHARQSLSSYTAGTDARHEPQYRPAQTAQGHLV